jgi:hypothetical protein
VSGPDRERVLHELSRAPTAGISRGEFAILMLDVDDDVVTEAVEDLAQSGQIVTTACDGILRFHPIGGA